MLLLLFVAGLLIGAGAMWGWFYYHPHTPNISSEPLPQPLPPEIVECVLVGKDGVIHSKRTFHSFEPPELFTRPHGRGVNIVYKRIGQSPGNPQCWIYQVDN